MTHPTITTTGKINDLWVRFQDEVLTKAGVTAGSLQWVEMQKAFYAGAAGMFGYMTQELASMSDEDAMQTRQDIRAEGLDYMSKIMELFVKQLSESLQTAEVTSAIKSPTIQ